jgi:two-component system, sensor histidine kinase PdtaS
MERLLSFLPQRPQPLLVRYGVTTLIVAVFFGLFVGVHASGVLGFYLLYPAIFLSAVLFDRGSGFYATALCAALAYSLLPGDRWILSGELAVALILFIVISLALAAFSEGLRVAWERAVQAEQTKDLLLRELGHRTMNNLNMVISVLTLQSRAQTNPEARAALENAILRANAIAEAHNHFRPMQRHGRIEMRSYLEQLCAYIENNLRGVRPVSVTVAAEEMHLAAERAVPLGLIVNELVTNALKHAFPGNRAGVVRVKLAGGPPLVLTVEDDGIGCPATKTENLGSRLVSRLVRQLGGSIAWRDGQRGCRVDVMLTSC